MNWKVLSRPVAYFISHYIIEESLSSQFSPPAVLLLKSFPNGVSSILFSPIARCPIWNSIHSARHERRFPSSLPLPSAYKTLFLSAAAADPISFCNPMSNFKESERQLDTTYFKPEMRFGGRFLFPPLLSKISLGRKKREKKFKISEKKKKRGWKGPSGDLLFFLSLPFLLLLFLVCVCV